MTEKLNKYLESKGLEVKSPSRKRFRDYQTKEIKLLTGQSDDDPQGRVDAMLELEDLRDAFLQEVYPTLDLDDIPHDLFRELLNATVGNGVAQVEGN